MHKSNRWAFSVRVAALGCALLLVIAMCALGQNSPNPPIPTPQQTKHGGVQSCVSPGAATQQPHKDLCVSAHVYDVIELTDGTRFLDVCPPELADDACRFTIISLPMDRPEVGDLARFRDHDVQVRGIVRATHGRLGIVLSHVRQFNGGPEKFRPNPKLLHGFNGQSDRMPVRDPNLVSSGRHRSFMNTRDREASPSSPKQ
jgi:hypothetical protein